MILRGRTMFDPCLGDAVQRWLRHHEPSSWSHKSTIKEKFLYDSFGASGKLNA